MPKKDCDLDKEDRLQSGRCVKKCMEGSTRHVVTERCRKNQTSKAKANKSKSKSVSPVPKKTVKRCPNGTRRNKAGVCVPNGKTVVPIKQPSPLPPSSSSESTTVPMRSSSSSSVKKPDSWGVVDMGWSNPDVYVPPATSRIPAIIHKPVDMKKKKRSPLGKIAVYERFNEMNKNKFRKASRQGKYDLFHEYQVNPRNTDSASYNVPGIDSDRLAYYNMLADKYKQRILEKPTDERMEMLNWFYALEHNRKK